MISIVSVEKKTRKKRIAFLVEESTYTQLEALKKRIKNIPDAKLHLDEVIDDQLIKLVQKANQQIDKLSRHDD